MPRCIALTHISVGRVARLKPFLCLKDVPLLVGFGTSSEVGELAGHSHCFSEDSEAVARRRSPEGHHQDFGRPMIRNENEYKEAVRRLGEQEERLKQQAVQFKQTEAVQGRDQTGARPRPFLSRADQGRGRELRAAEWHARPASASMRFEN